MVGMIFVRKSIHLSTSIFVSTIFNHSTAELFISYESVMDTLEASLLALLFQLVGDVVFVFSRLITVSVPVRSSFLYVVRNRKEVHRVLDEFLIFLFLNARSARTCSRRCQCPSMIDILCTVLWGPSRAIHTIQCFQLHESFVLILDKGLNDRLCRRSR